MDTALWIVGIWFALSLVASPLIGLLGRANDTPSPVRNPGPPPGGG